MQQRFLICICLLGLVAGVFQPCTLAQSTGLLIPEGTEMQLSLAEPLSSKLNDVGDDVYAVLRRDVVVDGRTLLRRGVEVIGRVTLVESARRPFKGGRMHVTFERIRIDEMDRKLSVVIRSASDFARDEKIKTNDEGTLAQGTSGGEVLRNVGTAAGIGMVGATIAILASAGDRNVGGFGGVGIGRGGAVTGAAILGGSVVAGVLLTKGKEVRLDPGAVIRLRLERALNVE
jgi:hypothetical protein